jgi:hypothetical protein
MFLHSWLPASWLWEGSAEVEQQTQIMHVSPQPCRCYPPQLFYHRYLYSASESHQ